MEVQMEVQWKSMEVLLGVKMANKGYSFVIGKKNSLFNNSVGYYWIGIMALQLKNILQIRENVGVIFDMCAQLRHNGSSVFGKTNNFQQTMEGQRSVALGNNESGLQGVMYQGTGRGAVIDFTNFYNSLRQNLIYIRENIKVYKQKAAVSQRFQNCESIVSAMIRYANKQQQMFEQVNSGVRFQRKKEEENMNALVNQRQNDLTKEAIIGILDGAQTGVALGGTADQGTGRI